MSNAAVAVTDRPGTLIDLSIAGNAAASLGEGWSFQERAFRWATGPVTTFRLPPNPLLAPRHVSISVKPFSPPGFPAQRVIISAAGVELRRYTIGQPAVVSFVVPDILGEEVQLRLPDARIASDDRMLAVAVPWIRVSHDAPDAPSADIAAKFLSLGSNCEFGMAQRRLGAEPIDLFRFASNHVSGLVKGFGDGFADIDNPERFSLKLSGPEGRREYIGNHPSYNMQYHTFIYEAPNVDPEIVTRRELRRLRFLARKLIEEAGEARRMFVYWHIEQQFDAFDALPLRDALLRHNPDNALLVVEEAPEGKIAGSVEMIARGLYRGTITRFAPRENVPAFEALQWARLCAAALAAWRPAED